jgi:hypothetical protein
MIAEAVRQNRDFTTEGTESTEKKERETAHSQDSLCHG